MDSIDEQVRQIVESAEKRSVKPEPDTRSIFFDPYDHPLTGIVELFGVDRIWQATKSYPQFFSRKQIKKACKRQANLSVVKVGGLLAVGLLDHAGNLPQPETDLPFESMMRFLQEHYTQWIEIPDQGSLISWHPVQSSDESLNVEVYPVLDFLEQALNGHPSIQLWNLHQCIVQALDMKTIVLSPLEP